MAEGNSNSVAIVAIIVIILLGIGVTYYLSHGFQFTKTQTTVVQPAAPDQGGVSTTKTTTTAP